MSEHQKTMDRNLELQNVQHLETIQVTVKYNQ